MPVIAPRISQVGKQDGSAVLVQWGPAANGDTFTPIAMPEYSDKSIQVSGTFGGASIAVQGSNDGVTFAALNDPTSVTIALTTGAIKAVLENTALVMPVVTGGVGTSLTVSILFHLSNPLRT